MGYINGLYATWWAYGKQPEIEWTTVEWGTLMGCMLHDWLTVINKKWNGQQWMGYINGMHATWWAYGYQQEMEWTTVNGVYWWRSTSCTFHYLSPLPHIHIFTMNSCDSCDNCHFYQNHQKTLYFWAVTSSCWWKERPAVIETPVGVLQSVPQNSTVVQMLKYGNSCAYWAK